MSATRQIRRAAARRGKASKRDRPRAATVRTIDGRKVRVSIHDDNGERAYHPLAQR